MRKKVVGKLFGKNLVKSENAFSRYKEGDVLTFNKKKYVVVKTSSFGIFVRDEDGKIQPLNIYNLQ
jgi:hypothetical protein